MHGVTGSINSPERSIPTSSQAHIQSMTFDCLPLTTHLPHPSPYALPSHLPHHHLPSNRLLLPPHAPPNHSSPQLKVPMPFLTTIVVPIVGNAAEHASALIFAVKNRMEVALGVAVGELPITLDNNSSHYCLMITFTA